jgi:hypothetical protein
VLRALGSSAAKAVEASFSGREVRLAVARLVVMPRVFARLRYLLDVDALKALVFYVGATLLLGLACARDLDRSVNAALADKPLVPDVVSER